MIEKPELLSEAVLSGCLLLCLIACLAVVGWEWLQSKLQAQHATPSVATRGANDRTLFASVAALVLAGFVVLITPVVFYFSVGFVGMWFILRSIGRYRTKRRNSRLRRNSGTGCGVSGLAAGSAKPTRASIWVRNQRSF